MIAAIAVILYPSTALLVGFALSFSRWRTLLTATGICVALLVWSHKHSSDHALVICIWIASAGVAMALVPRLLGGMIGLALNPRSYRKTH